MVSIRLNQVEEIPVRCLASIFEWRKVGREIGAADAKTKEAIDFESVGRICEAHKVRDA